MIKKSQIILIGLVSLVFLSALAGTLLLRRSDAAKGTVSIRDAERQEVAIAIEGDLLNINLASAQQLEALPRIGETLAGRIVEYRRLNGDFKSKEDLLNVKGLTRSILDEIEPYITLGGTS